MAMVMPIVIDLMIVDLVIAALNHCTEYCARTSEVSERVARPKQGHAPNRAARQGFIKQKP